MRRIRKVQKSYSKLRRIPSLQVEQAYSGPDILRALPSGASVWLGEEKIDVQRGGVARNGSDPMRKKGTS